MFTLNCKGKLLTLDGPVVMGIINATPDSFYKSDLKSDEASLLAMAGKMITDGATILDIGGQSTKPASALGSIPPVSQHSRHCNGVVMFLGPKPARTLNRKL